MSVYTILDERHTVTAAVWAQQNECYKQQTDLLSTDWLRAAQRTPAIGVVRRRGRPKQLNSQVSKATQLTTQLDVEWSWVVSL